MSADVAEQFNALVHSAVSEVTSSRHESDAVVEVCTDQVLAVCGRMAAKTLQIQRWRWRGHEAARQVATYLAFCQPPAGWLRAKANVTADDMPRCVLWAREGVVLADLLATGRTGGRELWAGDVTSRPGTLVARCREALGDEFVGVRVLSLLGPSASVFVDDPAAPPRPLSDTVWAFGLGGTATRSDLAAAAAGELTP